MTVAEILMIANILKPTNKVLRIKISGDGYQRNRKEGQVMWCFTFLDLARPHSQIATWEFAVVNSTEQHDVLFEISKKFRTNIETIVENGLLLHGELYKLDLYLCADQKFLHVILGLRGACSKFWCIWCEIDKKSKFNIHDMNKASIVSLYCSVWS